MAHGKSPTHKRKAKKPAGPGKKTAAAGKTRGSASQGKTQSAARSASKSSRERRVLPREEDSGGRHIAGTGPVRLQKLLAAAGFGSRRSMEQFLVDGRVTINGRTAELGDRADPGADDIRVDGERLAKEKPIYWLVNKPRGVLTTVRDDSGRRTVMDLLPRNVGRVFPVGRLDMETTGLLLMTNDGDTAHALLHPSLGNEREYRVSVRGRMDEKAVRRIEKGVSLEEGKTAPGRVSQLRFDPETEQSNFLLTLVEGRKRQIRRSLLILGFPVRRLARIRMGPLRIGRLAVGEARPLRSEERRQLLDHADRLRGRAQSGPARPKRGPAASRPARAHQRTPSSRKGIKK